jgi:hypothetical protein
MRTDFWGNSRFTYEFFAVAPQAILWICFDFCRRY